MSFCFMVFKDWHQKYFTKDPKREETPSGHSCGNCYFSPLSLCWSCSLLSVVRLSCLSGASCVLRLPRVALLTPDVLCFQHEQILFIHTGECLSPPRAPQKGKLGARGTLGCGTSSISHLLDLSTKTWNKCSIPWDEPAWGMAQPGLQHFGANSQ